jgi:hypothetical protein
MWETRHDSLVSNFTYDSDGKDGDLFHLLETAFAAL